VIFADEPSTGLDATSAYQVMTTLKNLAKKGRTVIVSIHQPRSEIWELFDRIILLSQGCEIYEGPADECIPYFAKLGHELPLFVNPAEFLIDLLAINTQFKELETGSNKQVNRLMNAWSCHGSSSHFPKSASNNVATTSPKITQHPKVSTWRQIRVLTARTFNVTIRDSMGIAGSFMEAILMGVIAGWIFYKVDRSLAGIRSRQSAFYVASTLQGYLILLYEIFRLTTDIAIFDRERNEDVVSVPAFLISRRIAKFFEDISVSSWL
jgi:hypothetical protein